MKSSVSLLSVSLTCFLVYWASGLLYFQLISLACFALGGAGFVMSAPFWFTGKIGKAIEQIQK